MSPDRAYCGLRKLRTCAPDLLLFRWRLLGLRKRTFPDLEIFIRLRRPLWDLFLGIVHSSGEDKKPGRGAGRIGDGSKDCVFLPPMGRMQTSICKKYVRLAGGLTNGHGAIGTTD